MIARPQLLKAAIACFLFALVMAVIFISVGCLPIRGARAPMASISTEGGTILTQSGDAQVPSSVNTKTATATAWLPAGSIVWQDEKTGTIQYKLSKDALLTTVTKTEEAKAPTAFTPPAPPTPKDEADGKARIIFWIALPIGVAAAVFGLVRDYTMVMIGGGAVAAGAGLGLLFQSHPILFIVLGVGALLCVVGPVLYHTVTKHLPIKP